MYIKKDMRLDPLVSKYRVKSNQTYKITINEGKFRHLIIEFVTIK